MERAPTKQKILQEALTLFSEQGYDAVSVVQIAEAVGIKAPSLYKHYKSKQAIFQAILDEMQKRYTQQAVSMQMNGSDAHADAGLFADLSEEALIQMGTNLFLYFLHDEYVSKFRKMLTIEQYHSQELAMLYTKQYADDPLSYQGAMFHLLAQSGALKPENPQIMALHFYAPLYLLLTLCDRQPEREPEALEVLEQHIRQFNRLYKGEGIQ
jgi:AcrR family transcriptional regulator